MKKLAAAGIIVSSWILTCVLAVAAELPAIPPIPEKFKEIKIIKPDPAIPKEIADLSGEWEGVWKYVGPLDSKMGLGLPFGHETRRAKIIVYELSPDKIKGLYGWAESPYFKGSGGWRLFESDISDDGGKKRFSLIGSYRMGFYIENGILKGSSGGNYETEMKRIK
jgi:hypothetical protein